MRRLLLSVLSLLIATASAGAQQIPDSAFHYPNPEPAYAAGEGPVVCVDAGHENVHTATGRYLPFAELLRGDGYRVRETADAFDASSLAPCEILVIANAWSPEDDDEGRYPHRSAFAEAEITALLRWIHDGGSLLLIVDHSPWPGAAADLGQALGVHFFEGYTGSCQYGPPDEDILAAEAAKAGVTVEFLRDRLPRGTFAEHAILRGRGGADAVTSVLAFGGSAFYASKQVEPVLVLGPDHPSFTPSGRNLGGLGRAEQPSYDLGGWLQAGALQFGRGRVVFLAEAAMCTAQIFRAGTDRETARGMNTAMGKENPVFCLNLVRWLSGAIAAAEESGH